MRKRTLLVAFGGIVSAAIFASAQTQLGGAVPNGARVKIEADREEVRARIPSSTQLPPSGNGPSPTGIATTWSGNVVIEANGVIVLADRATLKDGEYNLEGNVRLRVPTP